MKLSELSGHLSGAESAPSGVCWRNTSCDRPICFRCGNAGHIRRYCPSDSQCDPPTCYGCGDIGHISVIVPGNVNGTKKKIAQGEGGRQEDVYAKAFMASVGGVNFRIKNFIHG